MLYRELPPSADLRDLVACHWAFEVPPELPDGFEHVVVPDGTCSLVAVCAGPHVALRLVGPRDVALRPPVTPGGRYQGVRFLPGAAPPLLGVPAHALRDRVVDLSDVAAGLARRLIEGLAPAATGAEAVVAFESALRAEAARGPRPDPRLAAAVRLLVASDGREPVSRLAAAAGVTERHLRRLFRDGVGLTPKELSRVRRLRAACLLALGASPEPWAQISLGAGFADQAHLGREFARMLGLTPTRATGKLRQIRHELAAG